MAKTKNSSDRDRSRRRRTKQAAQSETAPPDETCGGRYYFDEWAADFAVRFIERHCRHVKGEWAGKRLVLEPWEREIIRKAFGWKRTADGTRRYRVIYIEVPRKNGKSLLGAAIGLLLLFADGEPGAEVYSAAADKEQAALVFDVARQMVTLEPQLLRRCNPMRRSIFVPRSMSVYRVLSADVENKHGSNPSGVIFDELHTQPNRDLWDVLQTGRASRRQPMTVVLTTAGLEGESIYNEMHDHAEAVLNGSAQDDSLLAVIYAIDEKKGEKWDDRAVWRRVNPNFGLSVKESYLEEEFAKAKQSPAYENTFRRLHLNQRVSQLERWIVMEKWNDCAGGWWPTLGHEQLEQELAGKECVIGLDLSTTTDLAAAVCVFPRVLEHGEDGYPDESVVIPGFEYGDPLKWCDVLSYFWCPEEGIRIRSKKDRAPYDIWEQEGFLQATEGNAVDHQAIRIALNDLGTRYSIREIAADAWNAHKILVELQNEDGFLVSRIRQGFLSLSAPTKELDLLYARRAIRHAGHPVLKWCANNAALEKDAADNWKPSKKKSRERIDGITALVTALARLIVEETPDYSEPIQVIGRAEV